jgi:hypothetical protein
MEGESYARHVKAREEAEWQGCQTRSRSSLPEPSLRRTLKRGAPSKKDLVEAAAESTRPLGSSARRAKDLHGTLGSTYVESAWTS